MNTGLQCVGSPSTNTISISNIFSTSVSAAFQLSFNSFLSPPTGQPSDPIVITSYTNSSKVDACTTFVTGLQPNTFNSLTATPSTTMTVNKMVGLRFDMGLADTVDQNDVFTIVFPTGTSFTYASILGTGIFLTPVITGQTVSISQDTTFLKTFSKNSNYTINFYNFKAPPSTQVSSPIVLRVLRNSYPKMTGSVTVQAVASTLNASVSAAVSTVWANTTYSFVVNISDSLSSSGTIKIVFPASVTLSITSSNCATLLGLGVNSSPLCTVNSG